MFLPLQIANKLLRILFYFFGRIFQNIHIAINIEWWNLFILLFQLVVVNAVDEMFAIVHDGIEDAHQSPNMNFFLYL